jgi:hypothetical protein
MNLGKMVAGGAIWSFGGSQLQSLIASLGSKSYSLTVTNPRRAISLAKTMQPHSLDVYLLAGILLLDLSRQAS